MKLKILKEIISNENNGFYLINGHQTKFESIEVILKIENMITKFLKEDKIVFNDITKNYEEHKFTFLSFGEYVHLLDKDTYYKDLYTIFKSQKKSNNIAENLDKSIDYTNYLAENLDKSIDYTNYLAEH
jgi:hypothetical protein